MLRRPAIAAVCGLLVISCSGSHHASHASSTGSTVAGAGDFGATYLRLASGTNSTVESAMTQLQGAGATLASIEANLRAISEAKRSLDRALFASLDAGQVPAGHIEADVRALLVADTQFETALDDGVSASNTSRLATATALILTSGGAAHRAAATVRQDLGLPPPPDDQA